MGDDHTEALLCISDPKGNNIVGQTFNFIDYIGGKASISSESKNGLWEKFIILDIEKYLVLKGVIEPPTGDVNQFLKS